MAEEVEAPAPATGSKGLNVSLWVAQLLLAAAFGVAGVIKLSLPFDQLAQKLPISHGLLRFIGLSEVAGALGLFLPSVTRIKPALTPSAAVGLATIMVLALVFHATRGEWSEIPINLALGGLAAFVAWGRFVRAPIAARGQS